MITIWKVGLYRNGLYKDFAMNIQNPKNTSFKVPRSTYTR